MPRVIPFRPPPLLPSDELDWVLCRAFGEADAQPSAPTPSHASEALSLSTALGLGPTIAQRTPVSTLDADLGKDGAARLGRMLLAQVAHGLKLRETTARFCAAAADAGVTVVLLKQAALDALGLAGPTTRSAVDIDVLVRSVDLEELAAAATRAGFVRDARWPSSLHPLVVRTPGPDQIPVECHVVVPYVRPTLDGANATLQSLDTAGLLGAAVGFPGSTRVPDEHAVAAHLISHALAQHRFTPAYGPVRLLVDSTLLELDMRPGLAEAAFGLVAHCVDAKELDALVELVKLLRRGAPVAEINGSAGPARLLAHVVHSSTNRLYAESLIVARQRQRVYEGGLGSWLGHHARTAFMPKTGRTKLDYANMPADRTVRALREPLRSTAEFVRGLVACTKLWATRVKGG